MFDHKIVTKEYKFVLIDLDKCPESGWNTYDMTNAQYIFANKAPKYFGTRLHPGYKHRVRNFFRNTKSDYTGNKDFLGRNEPATEANLTRAMVRKLKAILKNEVLDLKQRKLALANYVHAGPGYVDMTQTMIHAIAKTENYVTSTRKQLKIWQAKYQVLKDQGVYTYLELSK